MKELIIPPVAMNLIKFQKSSWSVEKQAITTYIHHTYDWPIDDGLNIKGIKLSIGRITKLPEYLKT